MTATIQDTLMDLFQQVIVAPDCIPVVPIDAWQEGSQEEHLLTSFRAMLERIQQSKLQAEAQLREREEQYRSIFEASTDALIICDLEGIVVEANPEACRMSGEDYSGWVGSNISYPKPSGTQPHLNQTVFQTRGQFLNVPGKIRRKDGTFIPVETHSIHFAYSALPHENLPLSASSISFPPILFWSLLLGSCFAHHSKAGEAYGIR